ncbi:MAG: sigma-70 family RNA polymerase sigma factor [Woeseiaceae bacterium]|nr:sigma-70 family RNA polymerase sigma factor [Woeseiaceae bacterium]
MPSSTVTMLLRDWRSGDAEALEELTPLVYDDLRRIAANRLRGERSSHTLQATALVNEAFLRLSEGQLAISDRAHFFAIAARMIRRILIDHGRAKASAKRGGGVAHQTLHEEQVGSADNVEIVELDEALTKLAALDERKSDALELHYFGGMTYEEIAEALNVSPATVDRDLRFAKAWLAHELRND